MTSKKLKELLKKNITMNLNHEKPNTGIEYSYKDKQCIDGEGYSDFENLDKAKAELIDKFVKHFENGNESAVKIVAKIEKIEKEDPRTGQEIMDKEKEQEINKNDGPMTGSRIGLVYMGVGVNCNEEDDEYEYEGADDLYDDDDEDDEDDDEDDLDD